MYNAVINSITPKNHPNGQFKCYSCKRPFYHITAWFMGYVNIIYDKTCAPYIAYARNLKQASNEDPVWSNITFPPSGEQDIIQVVCEWLY